jgi:2-oxoisovalerate dehydrogenase E1 component
MMRTSVKLAREQQRLVVFLEPIALYMAKDLHTEGDGLWTSEYVTPLAEKKSLTSDDLSQKISVYGTGKSVCILSYGNGYYLARKAERILEQQGVDCRVIDLRWLAPLDEKGIIEQAKCCENVLIVDECRQTGSISEALFTLLAETEITRNKVKISRITAHESFIPLGSAAYHVLPSTEQIVEEALRLVGT